MKKTERSNKTRTASGHVLSLMQSLKPGEVFYFDGPARVVTRYSDYYQVPVTTETIVSLQNISGEPIAKKLTKVTIKQKTQ